MKIIFFGSDDFAAVSLEKLIAEHHQVLCVVSPPDRARDRNKVTFLPVKMLALEHGIPIIQPEELEDRDFQDRLASFQADVFVVIAYGKIFPKKILDMPAQFCINVHASLLPKYRGAAPVNRAVINGEERTGITLIKMNERMDAGEMIAQDAVDIPDDMNARTLREHLADLGAKVLVRCLESLRADRITLTPQDERAATFAPKLDRDIEVINWMKPAWDIHNLVRGLAPRPGAYTMFKGRRLKILKTSVTDETASSDHPGTVVQLTKDGFLVACSRGRLLVRRVHPESSKAMDAVSFCVGHQVAAGDRLNTEK